MPDCWHIDASGKSSPEVFQKHFGLPRSLRNDKKLLEVSVLRQKRVLHFMWRLLHYRNLGLQIMLMGDKHASPEAHAMARYDEGWHLRNEEDLIEVAKLDEDDLNAKLTDLLAQKRDKEYKLQQVKVQMLANRANTTVDRAFEVMGKCAIETWLRARNDLANWDKLDDQEKELLAEVIFCGYTFFGKAALEDVATIEPSVFAYCRTFRGLPPLVVNIAPVVPAVQAVPHKPVDELPTKVSKDVPARSALGDSTARSVVEPASKMEQAAPVKTVAKPAVVPTQAAPASAAPKQDAALPAGAPAPNSLQQLYSLIGSLSKEALDSNDVGPEQAQQIRDLLDQHLERLTELYARLTPEDVRALIERYSDAVLNMAKALEFDNSDQRDLVPVLRTAWKITVVSALEDGRPRAWFEVNLSERQQLPEFVERFEAEQSRIAAATKEIDALRTQLAQAKFTARASLKAKETHNNNEISSAHQELETIRVEAAHYLVPEGRTLDDLMEDESLLAEVNIEVEGFNPQTVQDLQAVVSAFEPLKLSPQAAVPAPSADTSLGPVSAAAPAPSSSIIEATQDGDEVIQPEAEVAVVHVELAPVQAPEAEDPSVPEAAPQPEHEPEHLVELASVAPSEKAPAQEPVPVIEPEREVEEPQEATTFGVDEALRHLHWAESKEEAQQAFRIAYEQYSQVPRYIAEAVALHWIEAGHLNVAYQILRDANESTLLSDRVLDASLLRSAFYGMNLWPKDRDALSYTQRDLNLLNHKDLEDQLERKPTGRVVPYLLVCATFQPALFAGGETQAATLLKLAADHFEDHLSRLITHTAEFTLRGGRLDLDILRNEQAQEVHLAAAKLQDQVNTWVELNQQRTNRWHALRLALRSCIKHPIIAEAIAAIKAGEQGDAAAVRRFRDTYSVHAESRRLLDDLVVEIRADAVVSDQIDSQAYTTFCQQMDGLVSIAQAWLLEVTPADMRPNEVQDFLQKFHTLLGRSIHNLESHPEHADLEHRAGSAILLKLLRKLQAEIKTASHDTWRFDQTDATFRLPETLARLDMGHVGVDLRLEWFAMRLTSPNWLADMLDLARRHQAHWVRLLLLRQLEEISGPRDAEIDSVSNDIAGVRAELKKAIEQFRNLSLQAMSVDIISEGEHLANIDQVNEWLEELSDRKPYVDVADIDDDVQLRVRSMDKLLNSSAAQLEEELNRELLSIRVKVGPAAVPEGWDTRARHALDKRNLSLVRELINQLKEHSERNARLVETSLLDNAEFSAFLQAENGLYTLLHEHPSPREAGDLVIDEQPGGLNYAVHKADFNDVIETLLEWRSKGKNKKATLEMPTYEGIVSVLRFLGIEVVNKIGKTERLNNCEYTPTGDFRRLKVRISRPTLPKGFPLFEGDVGSSQPLNIIFVQGNWNQVGLIDLIERHGQPDRAILMVGQPLSPEERRGFAAFCRDHKCTIFLLDPVILSYVATARHRQMMLETFLRVSAAWTSYNPYTKGDARLPAPPEMRFGRENDIASLVEPRGAALVYGGRQLGKTTLLNAAVQEFKKRDPLQNHAFYMPMDGIFQHVVERGINVKKRLFEQLVVKLIDDEVLTSNLSNAQMDPEDRLRQEFLRPGTKRVLFCLDEIDSVLNKDAATNFELVRSLKALVNDPHHRFRVVFAGLNNVNRFRTYPNVPLEQLGSPLEVGILSSQDARSLILQPLTALGYRFEEPELVDRIMAFTNRHPSLLHIFCSELVEQLGRDRSRQDGFRLIRQSDIENIENNSDVRRLSGERFDMTLNLDKRYTVAVYGLIAAYDKGIGKFTVSKALEVARTWVPEEFEQMSESGFESLLLELVGLGVLRVDDKAKRQYALRNQSILQLIGSMDDIQHKLQVAIDDLKNHAEDVLTCHATCPAPNPIPSPLSLQDERMILSAKPPEGAPKYSVSLIMGTPALGMTLKGMQEGFGAINEFQSGTQMFNYETRVVTDTATMDLKRFSDTIHTAIGAWASANPAVVLISLEDCSSIDRIMDLISIANEKASQATRLKHPLRLVFLLGARAMWSWHAHSWLTTAPNEIGGQVELNRWTRHACEGLLEQQGMSVTSEQGDMLRSATEGWYVFLMKFIEVRKKKASASSFNDFSKVFTPLVELPPKEFEKFLLQSGMNCVEWSLPLAGKLKEFEALSNFSKEDLQTAIGFMGEEQPDFPITPEQSDAVVRWWAALRVIEVNTKAKSKAAHREGKITYSFIRSIQRAIGEHVNQSGAKEARP
ncbi:p-loop-containing nucleoside triphosphate hydrolase [Aromatoleum bremense]|nr:p-loop-containing nucleoside triphosphate hydrolase [Aromatoleum bremense]